MFSLSRLTGWPSNPLAVRLESLNYWGDSLCKIGTISATSGAT